MSPGRRQENNCHVNLLKKWNSAAADPAQALLVTFDTEQSEMDSNESKVDLFEWTVGERTVERMEGTKTDDLTSTKREQLQEVMKRYPSVFSTNPWRTTVAQHNIYVTDEYARSHIGYHTLGEK